MEMAMKMSKTKAIPGPGIGSSTKLTRCIWTEFARTRLVEHDLPNRPPTTRNQLRASPNKAQKPNIYINIPYTVYIYICIKHKKIATSKWYQTDPSESKSGQESLTGKHSISNTYNLPLLTLPSALLPSAVD